MFGRRLIDVLTRNQRGKISTASSLKLASQQSSSSRTGSVELHPISRRVPFSFKTLLRPLQLFVPGFKNIAPAVTSINRVLNYSGFSMSARREELDDPLTPGSIEALGQPGVLDELREKYMQARKDSSNVWLDYSNRSCYIFLFRGGGEPSKSIAAFDLDGTLIRPKSNKRIPKSATDWELFSVWTKVKLQQCLKVDNKARFVIFTNQNGVGLNIVPLDEVQRRIELVTKRLDVPCIVFVAVEKDEFRKPNTGMYHLFNQSFNDSLPIDRESSFYCGDAIGYPSHSDADIKFAQKLGLPFLTPEKFLRGVKPKLIINELNSN